MNNIFSKSDVNFIRNTIKKSTLWKSFTMTDKHTEYGIIYIELGKMTDISGSDHFSDTLQRGLLSRGFIITTSNPKYLMISKIKSKFTGYDIE